MCGRYSYGDKKYPNLAWSGFQRVLTKDGVKIVEKVTIEPNFNVAPTQTMPVLVAPSDPQTSDVSLEYMAWGIERQIGPDLRKQIINTRSDKAFERFWNKIASEERCLIPATSFFEWQTTKEGKKPFAIRPKNGQPFMFAGICHNGTYSIMTTVPNKEMRAIHSRMPVILHPEDYKAWLEGQDREAIEPFLRPYEDDGLEMYEVSTAVNNVKNNSEAVLTPVSN